MKRLLGIGLVIALAGWAGMSAALAEEHGGTTMSSAPASSTSTATPQITSAEGSISGVDLQGNTLKLTAASGMVSTLTLEPGTTTVWRGNQMGTVNDLKVGEGAKVRYVAKEGRKIAKSIEVKSSTAAK